jgi:hypothetical protein
MSPQSSDGVAGSYRGRTAVDTERGVERDRGVARERREHPEICDGMVAQRLYWWRNRLDGGAKANERAATRFVPVTVGSSSKVAAEARWSCRREVKHAGKDVAHARPVRGSLLP